MSRYIDADKALEDADTIDPKYKTLIEQVKRIINAQPTADVTEVVRCKDCKYWVCALKVHQFLRDELMSQCEINKHYRLGRDFCSYGEREDGDNDE